MVGRRVVIIGLPFSLPPVALHECSSSMLPPSHAVSSNAEMYTCGLHRSRCEKYLVAAASQDHGCKPTMFTIHACPRHKRRLALFPLIILNYN